VLQLPDHFNVATYVVDRNVLEGRGDRIAIECGERKITYAELLQQTNRAGNVLLKLGVRRKERVLILLQDVPEFLYCFFGAIKIGAVAVPISTFLRPPDYQYIVKDAEARVTIIGEAFVENIGLASGELRGSANQLIVVGRALQGCIDFDEVEDTSSELAAADTSKDDAAFWLYSSGSTGPPKGCVHLHHDIVFPTEYYAKAILRISENDRCYSVARLFFAYGLGNAGYFPLAAGATTILSPARPTPEVIFADVERYRPTLFYSVPSNYAALLAYHRKGCDFDLSSIRHAISAGEPLPPAVFQRFKDRFGIEILDALGSTEMLHMVISNRPGEVKPGSSGKIIPGLEARIVDEKNHDVPPGEIGNLLIKCDATCDGYWKQHERTKISFLGPWFRTGDKYYQDEAGYFWYAGRADDLFKVNGRWLSPTEVEAVLISHPSVQEAAVVAREDVDGLLKPAAYVVLSPDCTKLDNLDQELKGWVGERVGWYKSPRWIEFLSDLPKTATGKLQRFKLRERQRATKAP